MSATLCPKFSVPFKITGDHVAVVEQDTDEDVAGCVYSVVATELGSRLEVQDFGITSPLFRQGGADLSEIQSALAEWEPRANVATSQELIDVLDLIRVEVSL